MGFDKSLTAFDAAINNSVAEIGKKVFERFYGWMERFRMGAAYLAVRTAVFAEGPAPRFAVILDLPLNEVDRREAESVLRDLAALVLVSPVTEIRAHPLAPDVSALAPTR